MAIHEVMTRQEEWIELHRTAGEVTATHSYGERMLLHDAASRQHDDVIRDVCGAMRLTPRRLDPLPQRATRFLHEAVAAALDSSRDDPEVDQGPYAYGVESIKHMHARRFDLAGCMLGKRTADGASTPAMAALGSAVPRPDKSQHAPQCSSGLLAGNAMSGGRPHSAVPLVTETEESRAPYLVRDAERTYASDGDHAVCKLYARALHTVAVRPRLDAPRPSGAGPRTVQAHAARAPVSIIVQSREAMQVAKARTPLVKTPLLASASVRVDGLEGVRSALVERSLTDARGDDDGLGVRGASDELLRQLLGAAMRALERRFADNTRALDKSYWRFWSEWCDLIGTPPLRTNVAANTGAIPHLHRREVAIALGGFMSFVADNCPRFKIESMLARMRGVARRHAAHGLKFVSLSSVVMAADGLVQEHIDAHGADSLLPASKEPLHASEIIAVLGLESSLTGQVIGGVTVSSSNVEWQGVRVFVTLFATMGCRKEAVALGPKEQAGPRKLMLHNVTYRFDMILVRSPSPTQLAAALRGEYGDVMVYIHPVPCKNDPTNQKFGNSPVPSRLQLSRPINLAREIIKYELMRRVEPAKRVAEPLVLGPGGVMWKKRDLDKFFKALFGMVVSPDRLCRLSVHSFRVYLACALLAAGATPEQIMQLLRWSSDAARKLYARLGEQTQVSLLESATDSPIDSVRSHTLLEAVAATSGPLTREETQARAAGEAVRDGEALLQRALAVTAPLPSATELRKVVTIDDYAVFATVRDNFDSLRSAAARHDAREGHAVDIEESDDDKD